MAICSQNKNGAVIRKLSLLDDEGELEIQLLKEMINERTKIIALLIFPMSLEPSILLKLIITLRISMIYRFWSMGHKLFLIMEIDVQDLDCDFYCFSGHKVYGPMGVGVLYGKEKILEEMHPYQGGGEMVDQVTYEETTYNELPFKFEAGTPNVAGVFGLDDALKYVNDLEIKKYPAT